MGKVNIPSENTREVLRNQSQQVTIDEHDETISAKKVISVDSTGNTNSVQYPSSVDGDSVYEKDINIPNSNIGNFSGTIESLVNDYTNEIVDSTIDNPKIIKIRFNRPISSNALGMGSINGDFSNVKILLKDLSGAVRVTLDNSINNTKYTSNIYPFVHSEFIEAEIQFHTIDTITLNGIFMPKQGHVVAVISGINDATGLAEQVKVDNGELIVGGKIGLKNVSNANINPATTEKQDQIIAALGGAINERLELDDYTTTDIIYVGKAALTSTGSQSVWQIQKLDKTTGLSKTWADGDGNYDNVWDNRASLSYN